jgi:CheY-like chemotaxis protein
MNFKDQTILLVEDNEDDVFIFQRAFKQAQIRQRLQVVCDGQEATDYFLGQGQFVDRTKYPLPVLVLLDLKLPLKHGLEVLHAIRSQPASADTCVIVLTSSAEERDLQRAQELRAYAYLVKPPTRQTLLEVVAAVEARLSGAAGSEIPKISGELFESGVVGRRISGRSFLA